MYICKQLLRAKSWKPSQEVSQVRDETDTVVEFFELFVAEITSFSFWIHRSVQSGVLKDIPKNLKLISFACVFPPARTHMSFLIYIYTYICLFIFDAVWWIKMCQAKTDTAIKLTPLTRTHHQLSAWNVFLSFPNHSPHTSPGTLSSPPGLLRPSGAMSRRGAGVHARPTGGLRTEGLQWPSACTSALGGRQDSTMVNRFAKKTWNITANGIKRFLSEKWEWVGRTDIFGSKNGPFGMAYFSGASC